MPRATRSKSARTSGATTPSTPVTEMSHIFGLASVRSSTGTSVASGVDDEDEDMLPVVPVSRTVSGSSEAGSMLGKRRRELAYVEIPSKRSPRKAKQALSDDDEEDELLLAPSRRASTRTKPSTVAKGKQKEVIPPTDDEMGSEDSLEYNEDVEESDDSGSEFEASEGEDSDVVVTSTATALARRAREASPDMDQAEGDMVAAAIKESLISTRSAARRGGAKTKLRSLSDAEEDNFESELSAISISDSEDDKPVAKGRKKATKGKGKAKAESTSSNPNIMTMRELKQKKTAERREKMAEKKTIKQQERALAKEYGRDLIQSEKNIIRLHKEHPELIGVWNNVQTEHKPVIPEKAPQPANLKVTLLPFQQESLFWMRKQENSVWKGGLLADEMGMGKTIQIIALLVTDGRKPNLVVAPTVAVMQWRNEIEAHTDGMKVLVWHGSGRETSAKTLASYDVVLTTYAVLESSFRKQHSGFKRKGQIVKEKSLPHQMKWHRVVLDEAHNIKERSTNTAKATFELQSEYKWCLSGTPLQNRVGELYSLIRFIGADPFAYYYCKACDCKSLHWKFSDKRHCDQCGCTPMQHTCFWNNEVLSPIQKCGMTGAGLTAFKKLRVLLDRLMLRRTKVERADDLGLPPRTVVVRKDYFSPEEKELYTSLFSDAKRQFSTYVDSGTVLNNYSNIFSLLTRMRQMACHPDLVLRSKNNQGKFLVEDDGEAMVCRLCNDVVEDGIKAKCNHVFDRECIKQYLNTAIEQTPACPVCHLPLTIDLEAPALEIEGSANARQGMLGRLDLSTWRSSTKIEALIEELTNLRKQDATTKSIVFSQFVNFLDLIAFRLQRAGFVICRLEGNMSPQARDLTIKHFMNNVHVTVFLVSLKAGGVALNLTEANRVYLMDSWWNPAVEYQAMDRIHRLGQHRPVQAIKLVVEDSIESRIVQLQEKKSAMVDATLSTDDSAMGRLTPEDLGFLFRL